jgi:NAD-dependent SIR2 family protein deacetylase
MNYLYISKNKVVSYDADNAYVNGEGKAKAGDDFKIEAQKLAAENVTNDLEKLLSHFKQVAVLAAAGTSKDNGSNGGKTRDGLWSDCEAIIKKIDEIMERNGAYNDTVKDIEKNKDIEDYLSHVNLYEKINSPLLDDKGNNLKMQLMKIIADDCDLVLDASNSHHGEFIRKMTARKASEPRFQLFTTNYDTLFEQAAVKRGGYTIIDGFSFSYPRLFSGANFDYDIVNRERTRIKKEESFAPNVFQLFKIHGSIDWEKIGDKIFQRDVKPNHPCIIYPASNKYESSYEQPYFEMMAHLQQTLRKEGTLLVVIGFGFKDKHIQNTIREAVTQNPNFHLLIVAFDKSDNLTPDLVDGYITDDGKVKESNVSVYYSEFKDFVNVIPMNS